MQAVHNTVVVFAFAMNAIIDHSLDASYFGGNAENEVHNTHVRAVQPFWVFENSLAYTTIACIHRIVRSFARPPFRFRWLYSTILPNRFILDAQRTVHICTRTQRLHCVRSHSAACPSSDSRKKIDTDFRKSNSSFLKWVLSDGLFVWFANSPNLPFIQFNRMWRLLSPLVTHFRCSHFEQSVGSMF